MESALFMQIQATFFATATQNGLVIYVKIISPAIVRMIHSVLVRG
jgi:hypothetical protein